MRDIVELEHEKAGDALADMLLYLDRHPDRHTPFMDYWFRLIVTHNTMVYPAKPQGATVGKRLMYGKPARLVEVIEDAARFGADKRGVFFVKVIGSI